MFFFLETFSSPQTLCSAVFNRNPWKSSWKPWLYDTFLSSFLSFLLVGHWSHSAHQRCPLPHPLPHPGAVKHGPAPEPAQSAPELRVRRFARRRVSSSHPSCAGWVSTLWRSRDSSPETLRVPQTEQKSLVFRSVVLDSINISAGCIVSWGV